MVSPTKRSPRVGVAPAYAGRARASRRPQHRFNIRFKPYQLQPFMIAPVLPGESLKNLMLQTQVWSSPLVPMPMPNIGDRTMFPVSCICGPARNNDDHTRPYLS